MNEKDIARYTDILTRFQLRRDSITKDDLKFFANFTPLIDEATMQKIATVGEGGGYTPDQMNQAIQALGTIALSTPEYKQKILDVYEKKQKGEVAQNIRTVLNTALAGADVAMSQKQINESRKALRESRRPATPPALQSSPELKQALNDAQQGSFEAYRALAPAQQQLLDRYLSDINVAKSTGQVGAYGALGQVASTRRGRGISELAPVADQINARYQNRYDTLVGRKLAENQAIQQSQAQYYPANLQQYQLEQQAAGQLGGMGRQNLRASAANLLQGLPDTGADFAMKKRMDEIYNKALPYGQSAAEAAVDADAKLLGYDPRQLSQYAPTVMGGQVAQGPILPFNSYSIPAPKPLTYDMYNTPVRRR